MDRTVPAGAAILLDFIRKTEVGTDARSGYDVIYGHNQGKLANLVTSMTLDEIIAAQGGWSKRFGSSATGGYQFMRATLRGLVKELGLSGSQKLDPDLQDRLGYHLLKRRGYEAYIAGRISTTEFGKRLAQEWASFPVLEATQGGSRKVKRGQSYYAGDGLNKALVKPEAIEALLAKVKTVGNAPQKPVSERLPDPAPRHQPAPKREPVTTGGGKTGKAGILAAIIALFVGIWATFTGWVCSIPLISTICGG